VLQNRFDLFALNTGKPLQKIVDASPCLQVLEQRVYWDARAFENPRAAHFVWVALNILALRPIQHLFPVSSKCEIKAMHKPKGNAHQLGIAPTESRSSWLSGRCSRVAAGFHPPVVAADPVEGSSGLAEAVGAARAPEWAARVAVLVMRVAALWAVVALPAAAAVQEPASGWGRSSRFRTP
jgi:hypothetical protein